MMSDEWFICSLKALSLGPSSSIRLLKCGLRDKGLELENEMKLHWRCETRDANLHGGWLVMSTRHNGAYHGSQSNFNYEQPFSNIAGKN